MSNSSKETQKPQDLDKEPSKLDPVEEASKESFPASDSPNWIHEKKKSKKIIDIE